MRPNTAFCRTIEQKRIYLSRLLYSTFEGRPHWHQITSWTILTSWHSGSPLQSHTASCTIMNCFNHQTIHIYIAIIQDLYWHNVVLRVNQAAHQKCRATVTTDDNNRTTLLSATLLAIRDSHTHAKGQPHTGKGTATHMQRDSYTRVREQLHTCKRTATHMQQPVWSAHTSVLYFWQVPQKSCSP